MKNIIIFLSLLIILNSCNTRKVKEIVDPISKNIYEKYEYIETDDGSFLKDGFYKRWFPNGQIELNGFYKNNLRDGEWKVYNKKGQIIGEFTSVNGELEGLQVEYYDNGNKKIEKLYSKGKVNGLVQEWHETGELNREYSKINGIANGELKTFHKNGNKAYIVNYKDGNKDGKSFSYDENGNIEEYRLYNNGKDLSFVGKWKIADEHFVEFFDNDKVIITDKKEEKLSYSVKDNILKIGRINYKILEVKEDRYKIEEKSWGKTTTFTAERVK